MFIKSHVITSLGAGLCVIMGRLGSGMQSGFLTMNGARLMILAALLAAFFQAAALRGAPAENKQAAEAESARSSDVEISARLLVTKEAVIEAVGADLRRQYSIVELTVKPRGNYPVTLSRDDFLLRSERDNERSTAESPERIAGSNVLVVTEAGATHAGSAPSSNTNIPGLGRLRRKKKAQQKADDPDKKDEDQGAAAEPPPTPAGDDALVKTLLAKELPMGETAKPVSGYLYFAVSPQQKAKNFWLHYKGPGGECEIRFK